jgi:hypothetical protein
MGNQQAVQLKQNDLLSTSVDVEPVAVVYNLENTEIENFVVNYLNSRGIDRVSASRLHVLREGNARPEASLYVFLSLDSADVMTDMKNVPEHLRHKMDVGGFRASDKLFNAVKPIVGEFKVHAQPREKVVYIKLNLFRTLGLMLAADSRKHQLVISEVSKLKKKTAVFTVIKSTKFIDKDSSAGYDRFSSIIADIEE